MCLRLLGQTRNGLQLSCPFDRQTLSKGKVHIFPDKAIEREIQSLKVKCNNCGSTFELRDKNVHKNVCPEEVVPCTNNNCREKIPRKVEITILWSLWCEKSSLKTGEHRQQCKKFPVMCPNGCGGTFPRGQIKDHTEKYCPQVIASCRYAKLGCTAKIRRCEESDHLQSSSNGHLDLACGKLMKVSEEHERLKEENEKCKTIMKNREKMLSNTRKEWESLLKEKTGNLEKKINDLQKFNWTRNQQQLQQDITRHQNSVNTQFQNLKQDIAYVQGQLDSEVNKTAMRNMVDEKSRENETRHQNSVDTRLQDNWRQLRNDLDTLRAKIANLEGKLYREMENVANQKLSEVHKRIDDVHNEIKHSKDSTLITLLDQHIKQQQQCSVTPMQCPPVPMYPPAPYMPPIPAPYAPMPPYMSPYRWW